MLMFLVNDPVQVKFLDMLTEIGALDKGVTWTEEEGIAIVTIRGKNLQSKVDRLTILGFKVLPQSGDDRGF